MMNALRLAVTLIFLCLLAAGCRDGRSEGAIRVGILSSKSGPYSANEAADRDAVLLAIDELNARGGVLGRQVEAIEVDAKGNDEGFKKGAERLIIRDGVAAVFGCWTSSSRKTVRPVFERYNQLLFYPVAYEGLEQSTNIVYTGGSPNQHIMPAVKWSMDRFGKAGGSGATVFLAGSPGLYSQTSHAVIRDMVGALRGQIVGERLVDRDSEDVQALVDEIIRTEPSVVISSLEGKAATAFFRDLKAQGIGPSKIPVVSLHMSELEVAQIGADLLVGQYSVSNYFQSLGDQENKAFVRAFKNRFGEDRIVTDTMEASYFGVILWAQAAEEAKTVAPQELRKFLGNSSLNAPEGLVGIDGKTQHTWKVARVGQVRTDGQFDVVWSSERAVQPVPFPVFRARSQWDELLTGFYKSWGDSWVGSGKSAS